MANTYSKIYLHIVFAVNHRNSILPGIFLPRIHAYMGGILRKMGHTPLAIGGIEDHVHCLIVYNITKSIPETVRDLKSATTSYINAQRLIPFKFEWQRGYGCFSYSHSQVDKVREYILHQYEHHKNMTLEEEIKSTLDRFEVEYDMRYIPKSPD